MAFHGLVGAKAPKFCCLLVSLASIAVTELSWCHHVETTCTVWHTACLLRSLLSYRFTEPETEWAAQQQLPFLSTSCWPRFTTTSRIPLELTSRLELTARCNAASVFCAWVHPSVSFGKNAVIINARLSTQFKRRVPELPPKPWPPATRSSTYMCCANCHSLVHAHLPPCASKTAACPSDLGPSCLCQHSHSSLRRFASSTWLALRTV